MKPFYSMTAIVLFLLTSQAYAQPQDEAQRQQIRAVIGKTYDQPHSKVETNPIALSAEFAIADWVQGKHGGRALMRKVKGVWQITACGGDGFKDVSALVDAGMPKSTAQTLVSQLNAAEKPLNPERVKQFSLFGTAVAVPVGQQHHH